MPLHSYRKATAYYAFAARAIPAAPATVIATYTGMPNTNYNWDPEPDRLTLWKLIQNSYSALKDITASSSRAGLIVPLFLILTGSLFIYNQIQPFLILQLKAVSGYYAQGSASVVSDGYLASQLSYVSNPGADYFEKVSAEALRSNELFQDAESLAYAGTMYLTIPALGFDRLPITANVESSQEANYQAVLNTSLAHFKGTSLPISSKANNIVIYGHSVGGAYVPRPDDVISAFSFLADLKVGDDIFIEIGGQTYAYRMSKSKIVSPSDFSIIYGTAGRETVTLVTCYPPGNSSQRLAVVATPMNI